MKKNTNSEKSFIKDLKESVGPVAATSYEIAMKEGLEFAKAMDEEEKETVFRNIGKAVCLADEGKDILFNVITGNYNVADCVYDEYQKCAKAANEAMQSSIGITMALLKLVPVAAVKQECGHSCYKDKPCRHTARGKDGKFCKASKKCTGKCKKGKKNTKKSEFSWF